MVVRKRGDRWILVRQFDHSQHAGALADAWSGPFGALRPALVTDRFAEMEAALAAAPEDTATTVYMAASA
jgi:hypothetical protein